MNVELLEKVKRHILEEPKRFDMDVLLDMIDPNSADAPRCGTVGCIAGWACVLGDPATPINIMADSRQYEPWKKGQELLSLSDQEAQRLFTEPDEYEYEPDENHWPDSFIGRYVRAETLPEKAAIAAERIDHFIATDGKE